jgi:hypothetical protein
MMLFSSFIVHRSSEAFMSATRHLFLTLALCSLSLAAQAEPTEIVVRVMSKDAKFVGSAVGGAQIVLRDADSGETLAQGLTAGGTGSTPKIMTVPHTGRDPLSDADAAKFSVTLDLDRPRKITVSATGPMNPKEAAMTVTSTQWVVPGKPVNGGDGWVLELRGFAVSLIDEVPADIKLGGTAQKIPLKAKVTMMCGCPTEPGGLWDANKIQVAAIVARDGKSSPAVPLSYAGQPNTFAGTIKLKEAGEYLVDVYAYDPANGNTGVERIKLRAQ